MFMKVIGMIELMDFVTAAIAAAHATSSEGWWVVSVVDYAAKQEFGTETTEARPAWRVAMQIIADKNGLEILGEKGLIETMAIGGGLTHKIANNLRAEVRRQIMAMGIYDTGNYYGSIGVGRTKDDAIADSINRLLLPETAARL